MDVSRKLDAEHDEIIISAITPTGTTLTGDCRKGDIGVVKSVLADLYKADQKEHWMVECRGGTLQISCDRDPQYGYVMSMTALGKGYSGRGAKSIRHIGKELVERLDAMAGAGSPR